MCTEVIGEDSGARGSPPSSAAIGVGGGEGHTNRVVSANKS